MAVGIPLVVSCQSAQYHYRLFDPAVCGPRSSGQVPERFYDNGTYLGIAAYHNLDRDGFNNNSFVATVNQFQMLPKVYGRGGELASAVDMTPDGTILSYDTYLPMNGGSSIKVWT